MAVEKLTTFLDQLVEEIPFDHPDRAYLERLKERHVSYAESTLRVSQVHDYEGRRIFLRNEAERKKMIASVFPVVSEIFDVPVEEIVGHSRIKEVMRPKFAASYLFHTLGDLGPSEIARMFGGKDHTTILNHISRARDLMGKDELFLESISDAENSLRQIVSSQPQNSPNGTNGWHK
ncbi:MAG TPA: helix-turn-helix domain-containing protein [Candidatus Sulfotelmatobacter sp.]|nr:helix-turn-helix domain-containing protein [Candidatus Sulfotelmatobacter sp.]